MKSLSSILDIILSRWLNLLPLLGLKHSFLLSRPMEAKKWAIENIFQSMAHEIFLELLFVLAKSTV